MTLLSGPVVRATVSVLLILMLGLFIWALSATGNVIAIAILGLVILLSVIVIVPRWQTSRLDVDAVTRFDKENEARRTLTQFLGGLAFAATLVSGFLAYRSNIETRQNELFSKAIDYLRDDSNPGVRAGGIEILSTMVAQPELQDRFRILPLVRSYVRERYKFNSNAEPLTEPNATYLSPNDLQEAFTLISESNKLQSGVVTKLEGDLCYTNLSGLDLRRADFHDLFLDNSDFRNADLRWANLKRAVLYSSKFDNARLDGADIDCADFEWASVKADQIKATDHWQTAFFSNGLSKELGLDPDKAHDDWRKNCRIKY
jgi:hypothetical protein